jgi:prepilin-type N-terminal cleavage/methylation domain-containing protein
MENSKSEFHSSLRRAFTLLEVMIGLVILTAVTSVLYETFRANLVLVDKNIACNEANTNLQWSYNRMLSTLESAALFVDCATYDPTAQTFAAVSPGAWGNAVRFMRLCPITCYTEPDDGSGYSVSNPPLATATIYLKSTDQYISFSYNTALYKASCIPATARVFSTYPQVSGTVSTGSSPGVKPGLNFDTIDTSVAGTVKIHLPAPLGSSAFLYCNRAYFMVEAAFAVTTDATDGHKILIYIPDTSAPSSFVTICQKLDGSNQTQPGDSTIPAGGTSGTFCMPAGSGSVQVLYPIRSQEYINVMSRDAGAAARNNTWINVNCKFHQRTTL